MQIASISHVLTTPCTHGNHSPNKIHETGSTSHAHIILSLISCSSVVSPECPPSSFGAHVTVRPAQASPTFTAHSPASSGGKMEATPWSPHLWLAEEGGVKNPSSPHQGIT
ncbi:hypothetical protein Taro_008272 [Colocasia esculenta]|uniref:Uncharacterized protein n=1 Tax=Colocasia esculenta TaxID=4460 RepID=A0A843U1D4_COLES|nr:hypothetical protein [Colocasia esculenta]